LLIFGILALSVSFAHHSASVDKNARNLSELVAADVAWREVARLENVVTHELDGHGLILDDAGLPLAGNERLLSAKRYPVSHDGRLVGYVIAPNSSKFVFTLPLWMFLLGGLLTVFVHVAAARAFAVLVADDISRLGAYADDLRGKTVEGDLPEMSFVELARLRVSVGRTLGLGKRRRDTLHAAAYFDPTTGLPNLTRMRDILSRKISKLTYESPGAFALINIDGFARASEALGIGGDRQLVALVAERLQAAMDDMAGAGLATNQDAVLGIMQADNFGLFLPTCPHGREDVSQTLRRLTVAFNTPFSHDGRLLTLGLTGGVVMLPEDGISAGEILRNAEMALQQVHTSDKHGFQFYTPRLDRVAKGRFQLESELRTATENSEFKPVFQPKIDFATGQIVGAEALARWHRDGGKIITPHTFIGVAEEIGLIEEIGRQILQASCEAAAGWAEKGHAVNIAVNVSPRQFERGDFTDTVIDALKTSGLPPRRLELEITESMAVEDPQKVADVMRPLRAMGVRLAIDDFGTGHSNLATLTQLPFDVFKIDRQFVSALQTDRQAPAIVEMILAMAETLGLKTVAEGVETAQQADFLRRRGCTLGQGYLYSPGIPNDAFETMLSTWRAADADNQTRAAG